MINLVGTHVTTPAVSSSRSPQPHVLICEYLRGGGSLVRESDRHVQTLAGVSGRMAMGRVRPGILSKLPLRLSPTSGAGSDSSSLPPPHKTRKRSLIDATGSGWRGMHTPEHVPMHTFPGDLGACLGCNFPSGKVLSFRGHGSRNDRQPIGETTWCKFKDKKRQN